MSARHPVGTGTSATSVRRRPVSWADTLRSHALEIALFIGSIMLLLLTAIVTAHVAVGNGAPAEDLTFGGTLDELGLVLSNGGPDRLARLEHATLTVRGRHVAVDTIAILADAADEPASAPGGFIADQVATFNDHAIRQAAIRATVGSSGANHDTDAPSLLRVVRTDAGERRLSERPNPFVLAVRSPYAERTWREVRTADWSSSGSLLGLSSDMPLSPGTTDGSTGRLNGRDCTIRRHDRPLLVYCGAVLASQVGRFYDVGFELHDRNPALSPSRAFLYRQGTLWRNGQSAIFSDGAVAAGDVLDVDRVGPFMLSVSQRGTLATEQWINGRPGFSNQRLGTISFFAAAGRTPGSAPAGGPLVLALDAAFSSDMENAARRFLDEHGRSIRRLSVIVLDVRTGEVKAIVEPTRRSDAEALLAFEPLLVGSVAKPLVAAAILARQPQLANLTLSYAGDTVRTVAGVLLERGFANAANGCRGVIAFADFIRCSSNQYAAELLVRSLRLDGFGADGRTDIVPREILERSAIGAGLAEAFDVDAFGFRTAGRHAGLWSAANRSAASTGDRSMLPWESRPWIVFPETDGTRTDLLARFAFGGWENRWTLLGAGEAYARIASGRDVRARILSDSTSPRTLPAHVGTAFRTVRAALHQVAATGTAQGLAADLRQVIGRDVAVLAKTGTLNEQRDRFRSLALVLGMPAGDTAAELSCGLVAVSWFDLRDDAVTTRTGAPLPAVHLEFARGAFASVLARHWDRVSNCPSDTRQADS